MNYRYTPQGICAKEINLELDENQIIRSVHITGGCMGNHAGIIRLVTGRPAGEIISLLSGTTCGHRGTSCPDQLAKALTLAIHNA